MADNVFRLPCSHEEAFEAFKAFPDLPLEEACHRFIEKRERERAVLFEDFDAEVAAREFDEMMAPFEERTFSADLRDPEQRRLAESDLADTPLPVIIARARTYNRQRRAVRFQVALTPRRPRAREHRPGPRRTAARRAAGLRSGQDPGGEDGSGEPPPAPRGPRRLGAGVPRLADRLPSPQREVFA